MLGRAGLLAGKMKWELMDMTGHISVIVMKIVEHNVGQDSELSALASHSIEKKSNCFSLAKCR